MNYGLGTVVRATRAGAVVTLDSMGRLGVELPLDQLSPIDGGGQTPAGVVEEVETNRTAVSTREPSDSAPTPASEPCTPIDSPAIEPARLDHLSTVEISSVDGQTEEQDISADPLSPRPVPTSEVDMRARRSIEALRFGIVPAESIAEITIGYEALERWVARQLPGSAPERPSVSEVFGPFGTGKSHTMAAIRRVASARGFVTAYVEVDGRGVTLSDPASVLRSLWRTIAATDLESATPLLDLNARALDNGRAQAITALANFERVLANLLTVGTLKRTNCIDRHGELMEMILACGDDVTAIDAKRAMYADASFGIPWGGYSEFPIDPRRLIGKRTDERPNDFVECLLGYSVLVKLAGYKGLVITIDEFEVEAAHLSRKQIERLEDVIYALAQWFGGRGTQKTGPLALFIATVGEDGHLGDEIVEMLVSKTHGGQYPLKKWSRLARRKLAERIFTVYRHAYGLEASFDESLVSVVQGSLDEADLAESGMVRAFIKGYVAELDAVFGPVGG